MSGAFAGRRFVVIGMGVAGRAAASVLAAEGAKVLVTEAKPDPAGVEELRSLGIEIRAGGHRPEHLDGADAILPSPGVPEWAPVLSWAAERRIPLWSELDVGAALCRAPYVAITGTNGKSTTTELVASMLRAGGIDAVACGNIGYPFSVAAREGHAALSVEASSFQLRFHHLLHPRVSVLLNVAPDHLDWHGSLASYAAAKARIFELQGEGDTHVGNRADEGASEISRRAPCRVAWFRRGAPGPDEVGLVAGEVVARLEGREVGLGRPGLASAGFVADCAAAAAAALSFGVSPDAVTEGMRAMRPLPHRGEEVARAGSVRFIDDSKATNVHAALHALEGRRDVVLVAGGMAKGVDLTPLRAAADSLVAVAAIGEAATELAEVFDDVVPVKVAGSIEEAVRLAYAAAPTEGTVLLAPACASWDMFHDYAERGSRFAAAARSIAEEVNRGDEGRDQT